MSRLYNALLHRNERRRYYRLTPLARAEVVRLDEVLGQSRATGLLPKRS